MTRDEKCLVLGDGFIGTAVAERLRDNAAVGEVSVRSRKTGANLFDMGQTRLCIGYEKPDYIFNCAAHTGSIHYVRAHEREVLTDNALMSGNLYQAVMDTSDRPVTIINPLSNCSYPGNSDVQREEDWLNGPPHRSVRAYGEAKRILYEISRVYEGDKISTKNFLVPNTFGPGDSFDANHIHALDGMIVRMVQAKKDNCPDFEVWGTGAPIREWGYITDIAELLTRSIYLFGDYTYPTNLAQGVGTSIREDAETIREAVGFKGKLIFNSDYPDGDPKKILDDRQFRKLFPYYVWKDHAAAIRDTVRYYEGALK